MATTPLTVDSYPGEYSRPPVYERLTNAQVVERVLTGSTQAQAMRNDLPASVRATL